MPTCKVTWKVCSVQIALWWTRQGMSSGRFWTDLFCLAAAGRPDHPTIEAPSRERKAGPNWPRRGATRTTSKLMTYLPDLLLSAYRAARRDPYQVEMRFLDMLQNPEQYVATVTESAEFQPRNFCDVVRLCDVVDLSCCDDADSDAETPAKRRRRG